MTAEGWVKFAYGFVLASVVGLILVRGWVIHRVSKETSGLRSDHDKLREEFEKYKVEQEQKMQSPWLRKVR